MSPDDGLWMRRYHPRPDSQTRLMCFPHAGGSASFFFPLSAAMPPAVEAVAVQYPGRQDRRSEPCSGSIGALADQIATVLGASEDERPLALFGHSMGGVLAFEVALRLEQDGGASPIGVIASGRRSPTRHSDERVHLKDDAGLIAEIMTLSGTDMAVLRDQEMRRSILPALRSDYRAIETYRYESGARLRCPISVFTGSSDPKVIHEDARAWQELTDAAFRLREFGGGHFYLADQWAEVAQAVTSELATFLAAVGTR